MKLNYIIIPLLTFLVAACGRGFTQSGMRTWYKRLKLPEIAPDGRVIGTVWTGIFILTAFAALLVWNSNNIVQDEPLFYLIFGLFCINAMMNVFWSFIFFKLHMIGLAVWESVALGLSVLALILLIFPISSLAAVLLVPYLVWVGFATYLNYTIWRLNK